MLKKKTSLLLSRKFLVHVALLRYKKEQEDEIPNKIAFVLLFFIQVKNNT